MRIVLRVHVREICAGKGKGKSNGGKPLRLMTPPADSSRLTSPSGTPPSAEIRSDRRAPPWSAFGDGDQNLFSESKVITAWSGRFNFLARLEGR